MIMNKETDRRKIIVIIKRKRKKNFAASLPFQQLATAPVRLSRWDVRLHSAFASGRLGVIEVRLAEGSRRRDEVIRKIQTSQPLFTRRNEGFLRVGWRGGRDCSIRSGGSFAFCLPLSSG